MNIILLHPNQLTSDNTADLLPRQAEHVQKILKTVPGETLAVGLLNDNIGTARLEQQGSKLGLRDIVLGTPPPPALPLDIILALPRPQMLKRIMQTIACFGVRKCTLLHTTRVEKSFWQSPSATSEAINDHLTLGLEQAKATQLPHIVKCQKFHAFFNADIDETCQESTDIVAHPGDYDFFPSHRISKKRNEYYRVAIGPEGGFTDAEIQKFVDVGFTPKQLGQRVLKVETAVTCVLSRMM